MITIEEGIVYRLKNYSGLSALVGDRIYPLKLPQGVILPAVTYQRISTPRVITHDQGTGGLAMPRFQFSAYDDGYSSVKAVIKQIREALNGYKGLPEAQIPFLFTAHLLKMNRISTIQILACIGLR
jgi:hypothetical protein